MLEEDDVVSDVGHAELAEPRDPEQFHGFIGEHDADAEAGAALHQRVDEFAKSGGIRGGSDEVVEAVDDDAAGVDLSDPFEDLLDQLVDVDVDR